MRLGYRRSGWACCPHSRDATSRTASHPVRRERRAQSAERGLPRRDRAPDPPGVGHDRNAPIATIGHIKSGLADTLTDDEMADLRAPQGCPRRGSSCASSTQDTLEELPWDGEATGELQARGPWIARELLRRPPLAGVVHRRRLAAHRRRRRHRRPRATSASSTVPRTSSSRAASGSPRSSSRTRSWPTPMWPKPP